MTIFECQYCRNKFRNKSILNNHQQKAKYCLKIQGKKCDKYKCDFCDKKLSCKYSLKKHLETCNERKNYISEYGNEYGKENNSKENNSKENNDTDIENILKYVVLKKIIYQNMAKNLKMKIVIRIVKMINIKY